MSSLFLKVFLWFWLAMALVIGALLLTTELTRPRQPFPVSTGLDRAMHTYAQLAAETYERDGRAGLLKFLGEPEGGTDISFYLFDERGAELTGRAAPPDVRDAALRAAATDRLVRSPPTQRAFTAHPVVTTAGRPYVLVDVFPARRGWFGDRPLAQALRLLAVLLTAGALCYLLARYLVSPVVKLRAATRRVAGGDFSARVGPLLGKRRDELAAMGHDFDQMAARVEALVSAQQRLIRDISHELRSPLARLNVALDLARKRAGAEAAGSLDRIERESVRLNEMIGQLLALSRWEAEPDGRRRAPLDLAALVREAAADADFEARGRDRAVRLAACAPCRVEGDAALLRSAVENVLRNAVRYTPARTTVDVALACEGEGGADAAVISVRDYGAGVPADALADIFRPFYRVADARDRDSGGTGLGLAITERAVRLHGGRVTATNHPDGGLLVELRLPRAAVK
ncbi:MAG TPA: ATP-binding protein [Pyrinomonadaceae bacterium]|jgi:two-component system sensor histidine kinase CpxA